MGARPETLVIREAPVVEPFLILNLNIKKGERRW